jgi:UDP-N-acetylmuramate dehydrogenase
LAKQTEIESDLLKIVPKKNLKLNEPMSKHTSFKVGGPAEYFVIVDNQIQLKNILKYTKQNNINLTIIGNGTNCLVCDVGLKGIVLKLNFVDFKITRYKDHAKIIVGSGLPVCMLSNIALKEELASLEFLCGIPGTVGGAVLMNAGAYGGEMKDIVVSTKYMDMDGKVHKITNKEHEFDYRTSMFKSHSDYIILETELQVGYDSKKNIKEKIDHNIEARREKQPIELPSAGSTFKRCGDIITAKLIDDCGLKGYSIGGAEVSTKHAGFIVNKGGATSQDILDLIEYVKKTVYEKTKVKIEEEILIMGRKDK